MVKHSILKRRLLTVRFLIGYNWIKFLMIMSYIIKDTVQNTVSSYKMQTGFKCIKGIHPK